MVFREQDTACPARPPGRHRDPMSGGNRQARSPRQHYFLASRSRISVRSTTSCGGAARRSRLLVLLALQAVHPLDHHEQHPGDDQEVDRQRDEMAVGDGGAGLAGLIEVGRRRAAHLPVHLREIDAAGDQSDDRHDQIVDDRLHQPAEGGADDHADGEIDHVALQGKFPEFLEHRPSPPSRPETHLVKNGQAEDSARAIGRNSGAANGGGPENLSSAPRAARGRYGQKAVFCGCFGPTPV